MVKEKMGLKLQKLGLAIALTAATVSGWAVLDSNHAAYAAAAGPTNVGATTTDGKVGLYWPVVTGATGYNVYVDDKKWNTTPITTNFSTVTGLNNGTTYSLKVTAIVSGEESSPSQSVTVSPVDLSEKAYSANLVPKLTSNTSGAPIVISTSSASGGYDGWRVFDRVIDMYSFWMPTTPSGWLQVDFGSSNSKVVSSYSLSSKDYGLGPAQIAKAWTFEASNTGSFTGEQVVLDVQSDQSDWKVKETKKYKFVNTNAYRYYRINVAANNGAAALCIGEMELMAETIQTNLSLTPVSNTPTSIDLSYVATPTAARYVVTEGSTVLQDSAQTTFHHGNLLPNSTHTYNVAAYDSTGNLLISKSSAAITTRAFQWNPIATSTSPSSIDLKYDSNEPTANYTVTRSDNPTKPLYTGTSTTFSDVNVLPNTTYSYTVKATNASGNVTYSIFNIPAVKTQPPAFDMTFNASAVSPVQIDLSFTGNRQGVTYKLYRDGVLIKDNATSQYHDNSAALQPSGTYVYALEAYEGNTLLTQKSVTVKTPAFQWNPIPSGAVTAPSAITLTYGSNIPNADYVILRNDSPTPLTIGKNGQFVDTNVQPGMTYTYTVTAQNANGTVYATSQPITVTTQQAPFTMGLQVVNATPTTVSLGFSPSRPAAQYAVLRDGQEIARVSTLGYTDTGVLQNTTHTYAVVAYDAEGNVLGTSNSVQVTTPVLFDLKFNQPTVDTKSVQLSWTANVPSAVAKYELKKNNSTLQNNTNTSFTDTNVLAGTTYTYTVTAYDAKGLVLGQDTIQVTTPVLFSLKFNQPTVDTKSVQLTWTANVPSAVAKYELKKNNSTLQNNTNTSFTDTNVLAGNTYTYTVTAYDANGLVIGQDTVNVTLPSQPQNNLTLYATPMPPNGVYFAYYSTVPVAKYVLKRDNNVVAQGPAPYGYDQGLTPDKDYNYVLEAYDADGKLIGTKSFTYKLPNNANCSCPTNPYPWPQYPTPVYPQYPMMTVTTSMTTTIQYQVPMVYPQYPTQQQPYYPQYPTQQQPYYPQYPTQPQGTMI